MIRDYHNLTAKCCISDFRSQYKSKWSIFGEHKYHCGTTKTTEVLSVTANCVTANCVTAIYVVVLVNALCQPVYNTSIPCMWTLLDSSFFPPPHLCIFFDFCKKSFNKFLFMLFFQLASIKIVMRCCPRTCGWCVIHTCVPTNGIQQLVHSAPQFSPQKITIVN